MDIGSLLPPPIRDVNGTDPQGGITAALTKDVIGHVQHGRDSSIIVLFSSDVQGQFMTI